MILKILYWTPRILALLSILFMTMFSFDIFDGNETIGMKIVGFLMQNIPVFILIAILVIAWKKELAGGILFIAATVFGAFFYNSFSGNPGSLIILLPFFLTGVFFIIHYVLNISAKNR